MTETTFIDRINAQSWRFAILTGIISIVLGVMVMAWPDVTLLAIAILIGIQLIISGAYRVISSVSGGEQSPVLIAIAGTILLIAGVAALRNPGGTVSVLAIIIGVVWIASGVLEVIAALAGATRHLLWHVFLGLLSLAAGIIVLANPAISIATLAWVTGLYFVIMGVVLVIQAFALRS